MMRKLCEMSHSLLIPMLHIADVVESPPMQVSSDKFDKLQQIVDTAFEFCLLLLPRFHVTIPHPIQCGCSYYACFLRRLSRLITCSSCFVFLFSVKSCCNSTTQHWSYNVFKIPSSNSLNNICLNLISTRATSSKLPGQTYDL